MAPVMHKYTKERKTSRVQSGPFEAINDCQWPPFPVISNTRESLI
jgi:hypothetical protein